MRGHPSTLSIHASASVHSPCRSPTFASLDHTVDENCPPEPPRHTCYRCDSQKLQGTPTGLAWLGGPDQIQSLCVVRWVGGRAAGPQYMDMFWKTEVTAAPWMGLEGG